MSVLIKGMEMPKSCDVCPLIAEADDYHVCCINEQFIPWEWIDEHSAEQRHPKPSWCPLVPVPPHGRLIDADEMKESIRKQTAFLRLIGGEFAEIAETIEKGFLQEIDNAPTIIEAEEGE